MSSCTIVGVGLRVDDIIGVGLRVDEVIIGV